MGSITGYGFWVWLWEREIYVLAFRLQGESLVCEVGLDALQGLYIHPLWVICSQLVHSVNKIFLKIAKGPFLLGVNEI